MDNNNNYTEKLVSYLDGELSGAEQDALQTELGNNAAMQEQMDNLLMTREVIRNYGLSQKVKGIHQAMMEEMKTPAKPAVRSLPKMIMRIAAAIILLVGLFGLYQYFAVSSGNLYNDQYTAYQVATMRGTQQTGNIEKAYSEKKDDLVILLFTQTENPTTSEQFLAAQAYLNIAHLNNAILLFNRIIEKNKAAGTTVLNDEAEYYLALTYLKNNETAKAAPLFKKIHDNADHLYHSKVSSWYLAKLKLLNWKQ